MTRGLLILGAFALLAACGAPPAGNVTANVQAASLFAAADNAVSEAPAREYRNGQAETPSAAAPVPPGQAEEAPIPAAFRGTWAQTQALCGDRSHPSRLFISGATLRFYESIATVRRVERLGAREINISVTATGEGTTRPAEFHYLLNATGDTLTDGGGGGMVRRRCA